MNSKTFIYSKAASARIQGIAVNLDTIKGKVGARRTILGYELQAFYGERPPYI